MVFVTKFDGRSQEFQKEKIVRTCLRMHSTQGQAEEIAEKVARKVYNGMFTREILKLIFGYLKDFRPEIEHQIDLRESISLLRPKPDFEEFVQLVLKEMGFDVTPNHIIRGKCVEHEIDAIAEKDNDKIFVEIKHHMNYHTYTGVDVCLETQARIEDLKDGFKLNLNTTDFNRGLIVCNTKFSDHAKQYASCKGIELIGWRTPEEMGLEQMIEKNKLYPITYIKTLDRITQEKLGNNGIVLLIQLVKIGADNLYKKTKIPKKKLKEFIKKASEILDSEEKC